MFEGFCHLVLVQGGARGLGFGGYGVLVRSPRRYSRGGIPGSGGLVRTGSGFWVLGVRGGQSSGFWFVDPSRTRQPGFWDNGVMW